MTGRAGSRLAAVAASAAIAAALLGDGSANAAGPSRTTVRVGGVTVVTRLVAAPRDALGGNGLRAAATVFVDGRRIGLDPFDPFATAGEPLAVSGASVTLHPVAGEARPVMDANVLTCGGSCGDQDVLYAFDSARRRYVRAQAAEYVPPAEAPVVDGPTAMTVAAAAHTGCDTWFVRAARGAAVRKWMLHYSPQSNAQRCAAAGRRPRPGDRIVVAPDGAGAPLGFYFVE